MTSDLLRTLDPETREVLRGLLFDGQSWESVWVDYDKPYVERVWRTYGHDRFCLHRIHPCALGEAFYHPHPWPSKMWILAGEYEQGIGYGVGIDPPPIAATVLMGPGSSYEMSDPNAWHYVRPIGGPVVTLMVSGRPFDPPRPMPGMPTDPLSPLSFDAKEEILNFFRSMYR